MEDEAIVWSSMLDHRYTVKVTRTAPYFGELTIADGPTMLERRAVNLSFDALFGPDVSDVASWQAIAIEVVDKLQQ